jgi:Na+/H+-dicarboxylate symporter
MGIRYLPKHLYVWVLAAILLRVVSTFALALGLLVVHVLLPGDGFCVDRAP